VHLTAHGRTHIPGLLLLLLLQVSPRPLITPVPLGVPGAPADAAPPGSLEEEGLRLGLAAAAVKAAADAADGEGLFAFALVFLLVKQLHAATAMQAAHLSAVALSWGVNRPALPNATALQQHAAHEPLHELWCAPSRSASAALIRL
jgi:hypothetical protein